MAGKPVIWLGSALDDLRAFPDEARRSAGQAVFVIHAFQKKTRKTAKHDIDLAKHRLAEMLRQR